MSSRDRDSGEPAGPVHRPVMLREVVRYLDLQPELMVVDGTVGAGGHSKEILSHLSGRGRVIGLDRDPLMLRFAAQSLDVPGCSLHHTSYVHLPTLLEELGLPHVDRVLLDLGLSSDQLADADRGFGFQTAGPLDLRFDITQGEPAWKLIERADEAELAALLRDLGEERFADRIARRLIERRTTSPVRTAAELAAAVAEALPAAVRGRARKHPATRVFQALRIAVNNELDHLEQFLRDGLPRSLSPGGRAVVISFHSLEDRLVKNAFREAERWQNLTPKPVTASAVEQKINPRSRTAKLRAAIRL